MEISDEILKAFADMVSGRLDELDKYFTNLPEYKEIESKLKILFDKLKKYVPEDDKELDEEIDDCINDGLDLCQKYYYIFGFLDKGKIYEAYNSQG